MITDIKVNNEPIDLDPESEIHYRTEFAVHEVSGEELLKALLFIARQRELELVNDCS